MYETISSKMWSGDKGTFPGSVLPVMISFLWGTPYRVVDSAPAVPAPFVADYHLHGNLIDGHSVLVIGSAVSDYWWIFKTHWDLVVTWWRNYEGDNGHGETMKLDLSNRSSLFLVDSQYRTTCFSLTKNGGTVARGHQ